MDEVQCRTLALEVSRSLFGGEHLVTKIAEDVSQFFPNLVYPNAAWQPGELKFEIVANFDRGNVGYIR